MSSLKAHLRSREYNKSLSFIEFCRTCAEYIIDTKGWENINAIQLCIQHPGSPNKHIRGSGVVKQWQALYKKVFEQSERVPNPCMCILTTLDLLSDLDMADVCNREWTPRTQSHSPAKAGEEASLGSPDFDFNDLRVMASESPKPAPVGHGEALMTDMIPLQHNDGEHQFTHRTLLEPQSCSSQHEIMAFHVPSSSNNQAFLGNHLAPAHNRRMSTTHMHPSLDAQMHSAGFAAAGTQFNSHQGGAGVDVNRQPYQWPTSSTLVPPSPSNATTLHSQTQGHSSNSVRIATLSVISDLIKGCVPALVHGRSRLMAQRLAQARSLRPQEMELLENELLGSIGNSAEQMCSLAATYGQAHTNTMRNRPLMTRRPQQLGQPSLQPERGKNLAFLDHGMIPAALDRPIQWNPSFLPANLQTELDATR